MAESGMHSLVLIIEYKVYKKVLLLIHDVPMVSKV